MISVGIPVFNTDVRDLVSVLAAQIDPALQEIIVLDDGSDSDTLLVNESIASLPGVRYFHNEVNTGRICARNKIATLASHQWLLFLDADSGIIDEGFIKKYLTAIDGDAAVITGGRVYERVNPLLCEYAMHWKYGKSREGRWRTMPGNIKGFQSNNFLIRRPVFEQISFPGNTSGYGHEDTWMGIQLEKHCFNIKHIDNPVLHLGLETTAKFLEKSGEALRNLNRLRQHCDSQTLAQHVKLYRKYLFLRKTGMGAGVRLLYRLFRKQVERNLYSCNPDLFLFDFYRMNFFLSLNRQRAPL